MSEIKVYYLKFNPRIPQNFFVYLRDLTSIWKKDVSIYITDEALKQIERFTKKASVIGEQNPIFKMTFKINKNIIDILLDKYNNVLEISFGPISSEKRDIYKPYKKKECSKKLIVY